MLDGILNIGLVFKWHLPYYKDERNQYILPWTGLHIIRDYYSFSKIAEKFPELPFSICITPSTYLQIKDYANDDAYDVFIQLAEISPEELTVQNKNELLNHFFALDKIQDLKKLPSYFKLYQKFIELKNKKSGEELAIEFSDQEYLDLQVWFLLGWLSEFSKEESYYKKFYEKDHNFTEKDKHRLYSRSKKIFKEVDQFLNSIKKSKHRQLLITPFFHPVLPIIFNSNIVKKNNPEIQDLPEINFPDDAEWHIEKGKEYFNSEFGDSDWAMALPEGAVSDDILTLYAKHSIKYTFLTENIVKNSAKDNYSPLSVLYSPHHYISRSNRNLLFFITDDELDEKIHLVYPTGNLEKSIDDMKRHLLGIRKRLIVAGQDPNSSIVTMMINYETIWSQYPGYGTAFIESLMQMFQNEPDLQSVIHDDIKIDQNQIKKYTTIMPDTKYNDKFLLWIGNDEDNTAWEYLLEARTFFEHELRNSNYSKEIIEEGWEHIHIAESSDWWWWFGEENYSRYEMDFDKLFRGHLMKVYELLGYDIPEKFFQPIKWRHFRPLQSQQPKGPINPTIDGMVQPASEWQNAVKYECYTMETVFKGSSVFSDIYIGYDKKNLFFRIDFIEMPHLMSEIVISFYTTKKSVLVCSPFRGVVVYVYDSELDPQLWDLEYIKTPFFMEDNFELKFPINKLNINGSGNIKIQFSIKKHREEVARFPYLNLIDLYIPPEKQR